MEPQRAREPASCLELSFDRIQEASRSSFVRMRRRPGSRATNQRHVETPERGPPHEGESRRRVERFAPLIVRTGLRRFELRVARRAASQCLSRQPRLHYIAGLVPAVVECTACRETPRKGVPPAPLLSADPASIDQVEGITRSRASIRLLRRDLE